MYPALGECNMCQSSYTAHKPTEEKKYYVKHYLLLLTKVILTLRRHTSLQATADPE